MLGTMKEIPVEEWARDVVWFLLLSALNSPGSFPSHNLYMGDMGGLYNSDADK